MVRLMYTCTKLYSVNSSTLRGGASLIIFPQEVHSTVKEASRVMVVGMTCTLPLQVTFGHFWLDTIAWSCSSEMMYLVLKCPCGFSTISCIIFIRFWWEDVFSMAVAGGVHSAGRDGGEASCLEVDGCGEDVGAAGGGARGTAKSAPGGGDSVGSVVSGDDCSRCSLCLLVTRARIITARLFFQSFTFPMVLQKARETRWKM